MQLTINRLFLSKFYSNTHQSIGLEILCKKSSDFNSIRRSVRPQNHKVHGRCRRQFCWIYGRRFRPIVLDLMDNVKFYRFIKLKPKSVALASRMDYFLSVWGSLHLKWHWKRISSFGRIKSRRNNPFAWQFTSNTFRSYNHFSMFTKSLVLVS